MSKEASLRWYHRNKTRLAERRITRGKLGLCKYCGKCAAVPGKTGCIACLAISSKQQRKSRSRYTASERLNRKIRLISILGLTCQDCGYAQHHAALQFDHVSGKKKTEIANMLNRLYSWESILKEAKKCELVCANCHALRTYRRLNENA